MRPGLRFKVLARDNYTCRYCGAKAPGVVLHVDHVVPRSRGGRDELGNLVAACQACNQGKAAMSTEQAGPDLTDAEYQEQVERLLDTVREWFWQDLAQLRDEWLDITGAAISRRDLVFMGELTVGYGAVGVRRVMQAIAARQDGDVCDLDVFEIRQMLKRWRQDGFA